MGCDCMVGCKDDFDIELVQGDYGSFVFHITDENANELQNLDKIIFTSNRLKLQIELEKQTNTDFLLIIDNEVTLNIGACTATYDITAIFKGNATPYTVIHNAKFVILKKENALSG